MVLCLAGGMIEADAPFKKMGEHKPVAVRTAPERVPRDKLFL